MDPVYFGCYHGFYASRLAYLGLLRLGDRPETQRSITMLAALSSEPSWKSDSLRLLADANWRGHLAPLISYVLSGKRDPDFELALWTCIRNGSWVSPQIVVGLHLAGVEMTAPAMDIIRGGIFRPGADPVRLHVETGPGSNKSRIGKLLNSLVGLGLDTGLGLSADERSELLASDIDDGARIAADWHMRLLAALKQEDPPPEAT
jgi:hypothetical protein